MFCYFDNTDVKLRAPFDALALMKRLGLSLHPKTLDAPPALETIRASPDSAMRPGLQSRS